MTRVNLQGRSVIAAMCVGQLGSLLPHVVVPSILVAFLIPEWQLSAQAGLGARAAFLATALGPLVMLSVCCLPRRVAAGILLGPVAPYRSKARTSQG